MSDTQTFEAKLGCDNCGRMDIYRLPSRTIIECYDCDDDGVYSTYHKQNSEDKTFILCKSCKLPYLMVFWWDGSEAGRSEVKS